LPLPIPDYIFANIFEITPRFLTERGIRLLLSDLDNTLSEYGHSTASEELTLWLGGLREAGILPFVLSNNRRGRPAEFCEPLDLGYIGHAKKPNPKAMLDIIKNLGFKISETALCGDQIYTDILCAKLGGVTAIAVKPISLKAPHRAVRYALESPFRLASKIIYNL